MDMYKAISDLVTVNGVTGYETAVSGVVEEYFRRFTDDVWHDVSGNTLHASEPAGRLLWSLLIWTRSE